MLKALQTVFKNISLSRAAAAVILLLLLNVGLWASFPGGASDRFSSANRSWAWWAVKDWQKQDRAPDILLLGSSLMLSVVHDGDALFSGKTQDAVYHHRCFYLEHLLPAGRRTFSMAIGGQMASDAYAIVSTLLPCPKVIIYGIAPRDFIDSMFSDPASTETYRLMARAGNQDLMVIAGHDSLWRRLDSGLEKTCFLYARRWRLLEITRSTLRDIVSSLLGMPAVGASTQSVRGLLNNMPEDASPGKWLANPYNPRTFHFRDNLPEYRQRYALFKEATYRVQVAYLRRFLQFCHDTGAKVVLVNMPLTPENVQILPGGLYKRYLTDVSSLARQYGAELLDFNRAPLFEHCDFADSVHVNGYGAEKFLDYLAAGLTGRQLIANSSRLTK